MVQLSKPRKCRKTNGSAERRRANQKNKTRKRTNSNAANGFLNNSFLPVLINPSPETDAWRQIENDFFNSLNNLSALYGFEKLNISEKVYPYNIALSFSHAQACMKELQPNLSIVIIQNENHAATLSTVKSFNTKSTLYFINVKPLHELLKNKKRKRVATLLQSVFTYLHKIAGVTYYTDNNKYLYYSYENISNWLTDESNELEQPQFEEDQANIELCFDVGRTVHKKIKNISLLLSLKKRNKNFKPSCGWEKDLLQISKRVQIMIEEFGNTTLNDMIFEKLLEPDEEDRIYPEQYISFVYDDGGWIYENVIEQVNNELQEMIAIEEPCAIQFFDHPHQTENHNLDFPIRLFDLINDLCDLLNSYQP